MVVDTAFYVIQRRYQQENLRSFDQKDWPQLHTLIEYRSREPRDIDYYRPTDFFIELGEMLHDMSVRRKRHAEEQSAEAARKQHK